MKKETLSNERVAIAEQLLQNANTFLETAIDVNDLTKIKAAKEQIKDATKKVAEANMKRSEEAKERHKVAASRKNKCPSFLEN